MGKKKPNRRSSGKGNNQPRLLRNQRARYTPIEIFMAVVGALLIVLFAGIAITAILGG